MGCRREYSEGAIIVVTIFTQQIRRLVAFKYWTMVIFTTPSTPTTPIYPKWCDWSVAFRLIHTKGFPLIIGGRFHHQLDILKGRVVEHV